MITDDDYIEEPEEGHFGPIPVELLEIEEELLTMVRNNCNPELDEECVPVWPCYSVPTCETLIKCSAAIHIARLYLQRIGELIDGHISESQFHHLLENDFSK